MNSALVHPLIALLAVPVVLGARMAQKRGPQAEHAVLFIIDGLSYKAPERLPLKNLQALIAGGAYCAKSYNILPAHPTTGEWARYHQSSIPNPVILAGTLLLRTDQEYVQHSFFPSRITAHAANDIAYTRLNVDFNLSFLHGSDDRPVHDDQTMAWALEFLRRARPAFMKVHLQDTGTAGWFLAQETNPPGVQRKSIWADGSTYRQAALRADQYLGTFLNELKALGLRDKTVLFVTADHGQADAGGHPFDDEDAWAMPLVLAGPGIRPGQRLDYAEQIDIVPTLCYLMGVKPPSNADGRILAEALRDPPKSVPPRRQSIKELNTLLCQGDALFKKLKREAATERDYFGLDRILEWHRFGSVEKLIAHNRSVLRKLSKESK